MYFQRFGGLRYRSVFIDASARGPASRFAEAGLAGKKNCGDSKYCFVACCCLCIATRSPT